MLGESRTLLNRVLAIVLIFTYIVGVFAFLPKVFSVVSADDVSQAENEKVTLSAASDDFYLMDQNYSVEDSFVYSFKAHFESGQAGGLVFGGAEDSHYWVLNVDRYENRVKLIYFDYTGVEPIVTEEYSDFYIGNSKSTESELRLINEKLRDYGEYSLKVIISVEDENVYAEFFVDEIKRFGTDTVINLAKGDNVYVGGNIGFNVFNSSVVFDSINYGTSDYGYYTELYRQQYHFSQYKNWNNDPNGLVYYNGYYHLYFQHNPYSVYWGDMYWGHARSRDLLSWEQLPICLFPDADSAWGEGTGTMWSGSAMVYHSGMSDTIDSLNWFENGNGDGLIAYYTRDGVRQNQVMMSSDDEGMTWTKRKLVVDQNTIESNHRIEFRDPKVFPLESDDNGKVTLWGMIIAGGWVTFYVSDNLYDWTPAGGLPVYAECPDMYKISADDGQDKWVIQLASRDYIVGDVSYNNETKKVDFIDLNGINLASEKDDSRVEYRKTDFGKDSYAAQTYYIDDVASEYYGKTIALNWFSGVPGDNSTVESGSVSVLREGFNGGGMTIPVIMTLKNVDGDYILKQTPITKESSDIVKTEQYNKTDVVFEGTNNTLTGVVGHQLEISATVKNDGNLSNFGFRVNVGVDEYTEIGYDAENGYYVDRTNSGSGNTRFANYNKKYYSGQKQPSGSDYTFYILIDAGGVEVFCNDFTVPMYFLTFASPYAGGVEIFSDREIKFESLIVNSIENRMKKQAAEGETILYISTDLVDLDLSLNTHADMLAYSTGDADIDWDSLDETIATVQKTLTGAVITAVSVGDTEIIARVGDTVKKIAVTVHQGNLETNLSFAKSAIISGEWYMSKDGLVGQQPNGDGYILAQESGSDFTYTAKFDLGYGAAAALIFRANDDMSRYYMVNYDHNGKIVKLWNERGELGNVGVVTDTTDIVLLVTTIGNKITVALNGTTVISVADLANDAPRSGRYGLNICATTAVFKSAFVRSGTISYKGGSLTLEGDVEQRILSIYNFTLSNSIVSNQFITVSGREIIIAKEYFMTLSETKEYEFIIEGTLSTFSAKVNVEELPKIILSDMVLKAGQSAGKYIGALMPENIKLNGEVLDSGLYVIQDYVLTISSGAFTKVDNIVSFSVGDNEYTFNVKYGEAENTDNNTEDTGCGSTVFVGGGVIAVLLMAAATILLRRRTKDGGNN